MTPHLALEAYMVAGDEADTAYTRLCRLDAGDAAYPKAKALWHKRVRQSSVFWAYYIRESEKVTA